MVFFSAASEAGKPGDAMSSAGSEPKSPNLNLGKSLSSTLNASPSPEVRRWAFFVVYPVKFVT
jgi:hypothetical protein